MNVAIQPQLLHLFPLTRCHSVEEASERIGRVFSPHRLELCRSSDSLDVHHNRIQLRDVSLNVLHYGADVVIDPGERGDFYMVQLPLVGSAEILSGRDEVRVDSNVLSILQPQAKGRMVWRGGCTMILMQVPRSVLQQRFHEWGLADPPRFALTRSRQDPEVAAWWQTAFDLTCNMDRYGHQWLRHPAAYAAMEEFLLSAFTVMLRDRNDREQQVDRGGERCMRRAKEYVRAHADRALTSAEIARYACVCPRTLEAVFKRHGEVSPLAYARRYRLQAVHESLRAARHEGRTLTVTEVAFSHGFVHLGRFAAQYRKQYGCSPSETKQYGTHDLA